MPALIAARKQKVNENFNTIAMQNAHREQAHAQKWIWAEKLDHDRLRPEAELRGITTTELASLILSKPDAAAERELQRQQIMQRIEAATTPDELDAIHRSS